MPNCSICAAVHKATDPHDAQSVFYQTRFFSIHGRWPTWADAIAHCNPETRSIWESKLKGLGIWTQSDPPWLLQAAYHEAGHVVAAFLLKTGVLGVVIGLNEGGGYYLPRPTPHQDRWPRAKIEREIIITVAGSVAQAMLDTIGRSKIRDLESHEEEAILVYAKSLLVRQKSPGGTDYTKFCNLAGRLREFRGTGLAHAVTVSVSRARDLLKGNQNAIDAVAAALIEHRVLSGHQARAIFQNTLG